jgi:hypothetical protein
VNGLLSIQGQQSEEILTTFRRICCQWYKQGLAGLDSWGSHLECGISDSCDLLFLQSPGIIFGSVSLAFGKQHCYRSLIQFVLLKDVAGSINIFEMYPRVDVDVLA